MSARTGWRAGEKRRVGVRPEPVEDRQREGGGLAGAGLGGGEHVAAGEDEGDGLGLDGCGLCVAFLQRLSGGDRPKGRAIRRSSVLLRCLARGAGGRGNGSPVGLSTASVSRTPMRGPISLASIADLAAMAARITRALDLLARERVTHEVHDVRVRCAKVALGRPPRVRHRGRGGARRRTGPRLQDARRPGRRTPRRGGRPGRDASSTSRRLAERSAAGEPCSRRRPRRSARAAPSSAASPARHAPPPSDGARRQRRSMPAILVSAAAAACQVELDPRDLARLTRATVAAIATAARRRLSTARELRTIGPGAGR